MLGMIFFGIAGDVSADLLSEFLSCDGALEATGAAGLDDGAGVAAATPLVWVAA
jgi:hypothetical protein